MEVLQMVVQTDGKAKNQKRWVHNFTHCTGNYNSSVARFVKSATGTSDNAGNRARGMMFPSTLYTIHKNMSTHRCKHNYMYMITCMSKRVLVKAMPS